MISRWIFLYHYYIDSWHAPSHLQRECFHQKACWTFLKKRVELRASLKLFHIYHTDLFNNFNTAIKFIDDALDNDGKVLVHCIAGRSRSAAIVCAYIIHTFGMDVGNVLKYTKSQRNIIEPNESFKNQLIDFYKLKYQTIQIDDDIIKDE